MEATLTKPWLAEFLFWLHFLIIACALAMGLVLPLWAVLGLVMLHRLHTQLLGGCALSLLQKRIGGLAADHDYLQQLWERLAGRTVNGQVSRLLDGTLVGSCLLIAAGRQSLISGQYGIFLILIIAVAGVGLSWWSSSRSRSSPLTCPVDGSCQNVISSRYSRPFGVPAELLGMLYFGLLAGLALVSIGFNLELRWLPLIWFSGVGLTASLYFIFIQVAVLKQICRLCMSVHVLSAALFVTICVIG